MLDLHVLVTHRLPAGWLEQCLDSVFAAARAAPYPVQVHLVPEREGDLWGARLDGYSRGGFPYVTYVDADDWLEPAGLNPFEAPMRAGVESVWARGYMHCVRTGAVRDRTVAQRVFSRALLDKLDASRPHGCCPACALYEVLADEPLQLSDQVANLRDGYDSLALKMKGVLRAVG